MEEVWANVHEFLGVEGKYFFLAPVCRQWREIVHRVKFRNTNLEQMMASSSTIKECIDEARGKRTLEKNAWSYLAVAKKEQDEFNVLADEVKKSIEWDGFSVHTAALHNNVNFFKWLQTTSLEWDTSTALSSLSQNEDQSLSFLKNMRLLGYVPGTRSTIAAARLGSIKILQWLKKQNCDMDFVAQVLAEEGHLQALKWANNNGIQNDKHTLEAALYGGNPHVVRYVEGYSR